MKMDRSTGAAATITRQDDALASEVSVPGGIDSEALVKARVNGTADVLELASPAVAVPLLCVFGVLLFFVNLGNFPLYTKGETREAVTVFDIVHGGGVVLPMRAGVEVPSKPLMMHWLAALLSLAAGAVNEWTVRLPSALFALLGVIACYWYARRLFNHRSALIAAVMLGTSIQYLQAGGARVDMTLTFFMEVAFFQFLAIAEGLSRRTAVFYLAIAGAVLTKGPIGLALPAMAAAIWVTITRRTALLRALNLSQGVLIVGLIGGGWYLAAIISGGNAFVHKQLLAENIYRIFSRPGFNEGHAHPFFYMEAALVAGFMPWSPLAAIAIARFWKHPQKINSRFGYVLVWFLTVLIFYNLPHSKRGVYLLALYPALCTMVALLVRDEFEQASARFVSYLNLIGRCAGGFFIIGGISAIIGCVMLFYWPAPVGWMLAQFGILVTELPFALRVGTGAHWLATVLIPLTIIVVGVGMLFRRLSIGGIVAGIAIGMLAITLAVNLIIQPAIAETLSPRQFAIGVRERIHSATISYFGSLDYGLIFYCKCNINLVSANDEPQWIVGSEEQWPLMPARFHKQYRVVLRSNPTELDATGRLVLLRRAS